MKSSPHEKLQHPGAAPIQLAQPTRAMRPVQREAREPERRQDAQRRTSADEDPRKRRHQRVDGDERR